jgi:hypothetical protein
LLPAGSPNSGGPRALRKRLGKLDHQSVPLPQKGRLRSIAQSLCFSGRTGAFVPFRRMRGTQGWSLPSHAGSINRRKAVGLPGSAALLCVEPCPAYKPTSGASLYAHVICHHAASRRLVSRGIGRLLCRQRPRRGNSSRMCLFREDEPGRQSAAKLLSKDEARRIAANIAKFAT